MPSTNKMAEVPRKWHFCSISQTSPSSRLPWQQLIHRCNDVALRSFSTAAEYRLSTDTWTWREINYTKNGCALVSLLSTINRVNFKVSFPCPHGTTYCVRERETDSLFTRNVFWPVSNIPPTNEVCEGYVFTLVSHSVHRGERGLHPEEGLHWGGLHCEVCIQEGVYIGGRGGVLHPGGLGRPPITYYGGVCIQEEVCIQDGDLHPGEVCIQKGGHRILQYTVNERAVGILLECILVMFSIVPMVAVWITDRMSMGFGPLFWRQ